MKLVGGKILGIGGEKCVYGPSFDNDDRYVTQIANARTSKAESEIGLFLTNLDPDGIYGNYIVEQECNITKYIQQLQKEFALEPNKERLSFCKEMAKRPQDYCALKVKKFTSDLYNFSARLTRNEILDAMINIFESFKFINDNNVAHLDVKLENMAYQADAPVERAFILADWGFAKQLDTCSKVEKAFTQFRNRIIEVGQGYTPWNPNVAAPETKAYSCEQKRNLLFLNDLSAAGNAIVMMFQLLASQRYYRTMFSRRELGTLLMLQNRVYENLLDYVDTPSTEIADLYIQELQNLKQ